MNQNVNDGEVKRVSELVKIAALKFDRHEEITNFLSAKAKALDGRTPTQMAQHSAEGFVKALTYLNGLNLK